MGSSLDKLFGADTTKKAPASKTSALSALFTQNKGTSTLGFVPTKPTLPSKRDEMIKAGEAVGSEKRFERTGKAAPSFGGEVVRGFIKPEAQLIKWAGDIFKKTPKASSTPYLGTLSPNTGVQPETFWKDIKKSAGVGAQVGANLAGFGPGGVAKDIIQQSAKTTAINLAKEGAVYSATSSLGSAMEQDKNLKDTLIDTAKGTALGAVTAPVLGVVSKALGSKAKLPPAVTEDVKIPVSQVINSAEKNAVNDFIPQGSRLKLKESMLALEKLGYDTKQVPEIIGNATKTNQTGFYTIDELTAAADGIKPKNKPTVIKPQTDTSLIKMKSTNLPQSTPKPVSVSPITPKSQVAQAAPETIDKIVKTMKADNPTADVFESSSFADRANKILSYGDEHIKNVVEGIEAPRDNLPKNAYISVAKNIAQERGDVRMINDLANSEARRIAESKSGQELGSLAMASQDNTVNVISKLYKDVKDKLPGLVKKNELKEVKQLENDILGALNEAKNSGGTKNAILDALERIKCK